MTLDEKLELARWMGWFVQGNSLNDGPTIYFYQENVQKGTPERPLDKWNPDTQPDFVDVWNKLTSGEVKKLLKVLDEKEGEQIFRPDIIDMVLNDLPKVMKAVIEVIK